VARESFELRTSKVDPAGGWENSLTLRKVYQRSDAETMLQVVLSGGALSESKA